MRRSLMLLSASVVLCLVSLPVYAAATSKPNELHVYAGELFGDDLTDTSVSGDQPELDDEIAFGVRYAYNFTRAWAIEGSLGFSPGTVIGIGSVAGGEIDMDVFLIDVDAVWTFTPGKKAEGYLVFGGGFASADLDQPIQGTVGGNSVRVEDDSGFTLNAGVGGKFLITESFMVRVEGRYRFIDALVDPLDDSLSTVEATVGAGWRF